LASVSSLKIWVTGINLGSYHVRHIMPLLAQREEVEVPGFRLGFNGELRLRHFEKTENFDAGKEVDIGGDRIMGKLLPAYSAAFKGLVIGTDDLGILSVANNKTEFFHKQLFQKASVAAFSVLFLIMVANTFFYSHFKSKDGE